jgi:AcrR family transcriptional regulator
MKASQSESELPVALQRAWGVSQAQRAGLTVDGILAAALDIADRGGIQSLTLRRLGTSLGSSAMALYRYVESRDVLLLLTFDRALGEPTTQTADIDWKTALEDWTHALFERYVTHPALVELPIRGLPVTPNHAAWIEQLLATTETSGLSATERLEIGLLLDGHVRNIARLHNSIVTDAEAERSRASNVLAVMPANAFPGLRAVLSAGSLQDGPPSIEFGIRTILTGISPQPSQT